MTAELTRAIAAWRSARLPGAPWVACVACAALLDPAEAAGAIAALIPVLAPVIELAGVCRRCALSDDALLFDVVLAKRGGHEIRASALSSVGRA